MLKGLNTRQIIIPLSGYIQLGFTKHAQLYLLSWLATMSQKLTLENVTTFPGTQRHIKSEWFVLPRQRNKNKSSMWELKQGCLVLHPKQPCPSTGYRTQTGIKGKEGILLRGDGQVVLQPNTSCCEITDWTVKTWVEQSQKYTGAVGSKNQTCGTINKLLPLCQLWTQIYTTASSRESKINYTI